MTVTLDHFGTGYSTLYHLRKCKLDKVKIDSIFIGGMGTEDERTRLVNGLVGLGQGLGLAVAARGIRDASESDSLRSSGCSEGQGGWVGVPVSAQGSLRFFTDLTSRDSPGPQQLPSQIGGPRALPGD